MSSYNTVLVRERWKEKETQKQHLDTFSPLNITWHMDLL